MLKGPKNYYLEVQHLTYFDYHYLLVATSTWLANNIAQKYAAKFMHLRHRVYVIEQAYAYMLGFTCFQNEKRVC